MKAFPCLVFLAALLAPGRAWSDSERAWSATVYHGKTSFTKFMDLVRLRADFQPYYLTTVTVGREITTRERNLAWEWEALVTAHSGGQDHLEFGLALLARWHRFPWNERLKTSLALGSGPSYALEKPPVEAAQHDNVSKLLNMLVLEITFSRPDDPRWSVLARIHHRSGAGGTIHGVSGGSNFVALGLRRRF